MVEFALIYAVARDGFIGDTKEGKVGFPWPLGLKGDLARFSNLTKGDPKNKGDATLPHPVIMGRKTYDSLPNSFKPLDGGRLNIILSRTATYNGDNIIVVPSLQAAVNFLDNTEIPNVDTNLAFIAGGHRPYRDALASGLTTKIYETQVHGSWGGDTLLPEFDRKQWRELTRELHNDGTHTYVDLIKR
jgi:dihydrofolate reductase